MQIHMTNTRTTDVEIIEKRYPALGSPRILNPEGQRWARCVIHTPGGGGWGVPEGGWEDEDEFDGIGVVNGVSGVNGTNGEAKTVYPRAAGSFHTFAAAQEASS
ncbi:hypothetical protein F5Y11DRAFT_352008 [Daldinia sp. FL1419]|nr:hypothetical protein F5Y11DRAFT_352008 [Daldinia sp. FL1419]